MVYPHKWGAVSQDDLSITRANSAQLVAWSSGIASVFGRCAFARLVADGCPLMWVSHPLQVNQLGKLSLSSLQGR